MLFDDFKRILTAFADAPTDISLDRGDLLVQIRDELVEARVFHRAGELLVEENGEAHPAASWITRRIAKLPVLADRVLANIERPEPFVAPRGSVLDQPDFADSLDDVPVDDASAACMNLLSRQPGGLTSVVYLTSDAGEGKTTLIRQMAIQQAHAFKARKADWLLVPVPLGGRTFMQFDDVVVAALMNNLRFQFLYYDAFVELVRLGVIVPAFDGFEEMIVEGSMGEAISALGSLVRSLGPSGTLLVSVRKAYFEYRSFRTQARLFDAVGSGPVAFARVSLHRWTKSQFVEYGTARGVSDSEALYGEIVARLGEEHPLLTRAVLVRRVVDLAANSPDLSDVLEAIEGQPQDYFFQFVNALVEREAREKWLNHAADPAQPLLTVEEHHQLLAMVAQELWMANSQALRMDVVAVVADLFAEETRKPPAVARQIRERLTQHALLVGTGHGASALSFDHEDFRLFYLGEALGRLLRIGKVEELRAMLTLGVLPAGCIEGAVQHLSRHGADGRRAARLLQEIANTELPTSFGRENCGGLAIRALHNTEGVGIELSGMGFPPEALRNITLHGIVIRDAYFQATSLAGTSLTGCQFIRCRFERLETLHGVHVDAVLEDCEFGSLLRLDRDDHLFEPGQILAALRSYGFSLVIPHQEQLPLPTAELDEEIVLLERVLRVFLRASQVNETVLRMKLGPRAAYFVADVLPTLLRIGVFQPVPYKGSGSDRRFKIGIQMHRIQEALARAGGSFERFVRAVTDG